VRACPAPSSIYTMPYVEGETLRVPLNREQWFPPGDVLRTNAVPPADLTPLARPDVEWYISTCRSLPVWRPEHEEALPVRGVWCDALTTQPQKEP